MQEKTQSSCLSHAPRMGTGPMTQACVLTGNQTSHLLLLQADAQPTEPRWSGQHVFKVHGYPPIVRYNHLLVSTPYFMIAIKIYWHEVICLNFRRM